MDYSKLSLFEIRNGILEKKFSAEDVVKFCIQKSEEKKELNAVIEIFDDVLEKAREIDKRVSQGENLGRLAGVPIAIKDNMLYKGKVTGCASAFMQNFVAPYTCTVVEKLIQEDAIIFGRVNMDEFAMGGSNEKSFYGPCHNAIDFDYVAGGSSGGSAVAVASGVVPVAIGTDTGGSGRQPAAYNGVVGIKPTYGTVSRYGIVAFASSLDQASPIAKSIEECEFVLKVISGKDKNDQTTIENDFALEKKEKYKIGICGEIVEKFKNKKEFYNFDNSLNKIKDDFEFVEISIPHISKAIECYYIIAPAEATSNLARFDGLKYAVQSKDYKDIEGLYSKSRGEGFGREVKKRIMLGNFYLLGENFEKFYGKARRVQAVIKQEFKSAFEKCDAIILPTAPSTAFKIGAKTKDAVEMYLEDLFTVPANIVGIPAISVPFDIAENGLPLGMQFLADEKQESKMFEIAKIFRNKMEGV